MRPLRWYTDPARDALWPAEAPRKALSADQALALADALAEQANTPPPRMFRAYDGSLWELSDGIQMRRVDERTPVAYRAFDRVRPNPIE